MNSHGFNQRVNNPLLHESSSTKGKPKPSLHYPVVDRVAKERNIMLITIRLQGHETHSKKKKEIDATETDFTSVTQRRIA